LISRGYSIFRKSLFETWTSLGNVRNIIEAVLINRFVQPSFRTLTFRWYLRRHILWYILRLLVRYCLRVLIPLFIINIYISNHALILAIEVYRWFSMKVYHWIVPRVYRRHFLNLTLLVIILNFVLNWSSFWHQIEHLYFIITIHHPLGLLFLKVCI